MCANLNEKKLLIKRNNICQGQNQKKNFTTNLVFSYMRPAVDWEFTECSTKKYSEQNWHKHLGWDYLEICHMKYDLAIHSQFWPSAAHNLSELLHIDFYMVV